MQAQTDKDHPRERVPAPSEYKEALKSLAPLTPSHLRMLQFHYRQPKRTATATDVAHAVGFKSYRAADLQYGRLAGLVGESVGWRPQEQGKVNLTVLVTFEKRGHWHWIMREEVAQALEGLGWVESDFEFMPGEMPEKTQFSEGAVYRVAVTAYERNPEARRTCLAHYGTSCSVCGFDFEATYGPIAEGFIHVHHIRTLSEIGKEYKVDPVKDLRPLCPNCHSVAHLKTPPHSVDELKAMFVARKESK